MILLQTIFRQRFHSARPKNMRFLRDFSHNEISIKRNQIFIITSIIVHSPPKNWRNAQKIILRIITLIGISPSCYRESFVSVVTWKTAIYIIVVYASTKGGKLCGRINLFNPPNHFYVFIQNFQEFCVFMHTFTAA